MPLGTGPCSALEAPAANRAAIQEASANFFIDGMLPVTNYLLGCERAERQPGSLGKSCYTPVSSGLRSADNPAWRGSGNSVGGPPDGDPSPVTVGNAVTPEF